MNAHDRLNGCIDTLRSAVASLRQADIDVLSAEVSEHRVPQIHVIKSPGLALLDGIYVRCVYDSSTHFAAPYQGCEILWIDAIHPTHERTATHG